MKRISKSPIILLATASLLTSCSNGSIAGTYGFQMGKETGTHFGLFMKLTDKYITLESQPEVTNKYKECKLTFSYRGGEDSGSSIDSLIDMLKLFLGQEGDDITVSGYYYKGDKKARDGAVEIKLGVDFEFIKDAIDDADDDDDIVFPVLSPETIEKVIYTTYLKDTVTMNIPVSEIDVFYQLYWYGYDLDWNETDGLFIKDSKYGVHEPGTHPTKEDVDSINTTFKDDHAALQTWLNNEGLDYEIITYRDFYTLAMGLIKR